MLARLRRSAPLTVDSDPGAWRSYGAKPLTIAPTPDSPFADLLADALEANLDFEIARQEADGSWRPNWSWAESHADAWRQVEIEWAGVITVDTLRSLKAFGRLP